MTMHLGLGRRSVAWALGIALAFAAMPAMAQSAKFVGEGSDAHLFRPAVDSKGYIQNNGTSILGAGDYSFGLILDAGFGIMPFDGFVYDRDVMLNSSGGGFEGADHLVDNAITGTLSFNVGVANTAVLGLQIPIMILGGPNTVVPGVYNDATRPVGLDSQGFGNIVLHGKVRMVRYEASNVGLAGILQVELPTGDPQEFRGDPGLGLWPILAFEYVPVPIFKIGLNAGYHFNTEKGTDIPFDGRSRPVDDSAMATQLRTPAMCGPNAVAGAAITNATCPGNVQGGTLVAYDDLITGGLAASLRFTDAAELIAETYVTQVANATGDDGSLGAEAIGGFKVYVEDNSYLVLGGGVGYLESINSADIRAVLGFIFEPSIGDRDGDGYKDDVDDCPDEPEDFDHFEDEDGCPEPDNDRDGILDVDDECPLVPEDHDGDADEDGCPEGTIGDRDGDGILDNVDECPDEPEDRDGFQDEEGCPDPDNDNDGILDVDDLCPNDPEDKDQFQDEDGCPDPDNDKDRILDVNDSCPNDPEMYNGFEDEDGCPDRGNVVIEENEILILEKIYFATDSAEILSKSFPIVDAVAATLIGNPQLTLVEVQGHADERSSDEYNIKLTSDRAASVVQALAQRGVDLNRLRSAGYGERCPIDPAHNAPAWEKNRRVEFKIIATDAGPTGVEVACPAAQELVPK
jgi:outer membrane protein OmpA-like peptidoglycan-associated protein